MSSRITQTGFGWFLVLLLSLPLTAQPQDLYCRVQVSHPQIQTSDDAIFQSLQQAITDFMNNRKWTSDIFSPEERIAANIVITVSEWDGNTRFKASAPIQSYRPVYGRSGEHTSELQSLMRISYAVFCLKNNKHRYQRSSKC